MSPAKNTTTRCPNCKISISYSVSELHLSIARIRCTNFYPIQKLIQVLNARRNKKPAFVSGLCVYFFFKYHAVGYQVPSCLRRHRSLRNDRRRNNRGPSPLTRLMAVKLNPLCETPTRSVWCPTHLPYLSCVPGQRKQIITLPPARKHSSTFFSDG